MAQVQRLFSSAGLVRDQRDFGTTPNMAPPSNLKKPVSTAKTSISIEIRENEKSENLQVGAHFFTKVEKEEKK
jgi:hypothetical protein